MTPAAPKKPTPTVAKISSFGPWLEGYLKHRQQEHPRYSLRSFSRRIGLTPGRLSEVFSGKRRLSKEKALQILEKLPLSPPEQKKAQALINQEQQLKLEERPFGGPPKLPPLNLISDSDFSLISEPSYYALLALIDASFPLDEFPQRLGLSLQTLTTLLGRLEQLGLIEAETSQSYRLTHHWISTATDKYSQAIRRHHKKKLHQAIQALDQVPLDQRDVTSWTLCIDPSKIPEAKKLISDFQKKFAKFITKGKQTEVYHLNIQLVPYLKETSLPPDSESLHTPEQELFD